ncbi:ATP-dependent zinc protease [Candidatus Microgenomates bacterium]|nr:ATP-dependent zinc protease [Candidatus Microgenomates bacterium]
MKLSIISTDAEAAYVESIVGAAERAKLEVEVVNFRQLVDLEAAQKTLGNVVYWRASGLDIKSERAAAGRLLRGKFVINQAIFDQPYITHKFYQQVVVRAAKQVNTIPTHRFRQIATLKAAIKQGTLSYPFVAKPNLGARGEGVMLIKQATDLKRLGELKQLIFQNYIPNKGDWRALVLGGRVLGIIKRTAQPGQFLNNVAQGGRARGENDPAVVRAVVDVATKATAALGLAFCGIDVILDERDGQFYFLEANTMPGWLNGMQPATGVDVASELVAFCIEVGARGAMAAPQLVRQYYERSFHSPSLDGYAKFHFASRLYLWTRDEKLKELLNHIRDQYLGGSQAATLRLLKSYIGRDFQTKTPERQAYLKEYQSAKAFNDILARVFFADYIYGEDLRPEVAKLKIDGAMAELAHQLRSDEQAIKALSTQAVNFIYFLRHYWRDNPAQLRDVGLQNTHFLYLLADRLLASWSPAAIADRNSAKLPIYLLTHLVINESLFYQQPLRGLRYLKIIKYLEEVIAANYLATNLDIKLEFLVCAMLCGYQSELKSLILDEAQNSLSRFGNFIVDTYNLSAGSRPAKDRLASAEHRSVLYLMSASPYRGLINGQPRHLKKVEGATSAKLSARRLAIVGRRVTVDFPELNLFGVPAKIDTGAYRGSLHCTDIKVTHEGPKDVLSFVPLDDRHPDFAQSAVTAEHFSITTVKHANGARQSRYVISTKIVVFGRVYPVELTLTDRKDMRWPVLLGRKFIRGKFQVDVSLQIS